MAVKIFIKRAVKENKAKDLLPFFRQLRNLATSQPGYISGETLKRTDKPDQYLIISSWQSLDSWGQWAVSRERIKIQNEIDNMLDEEAIYEIYQYG
jgi:heme-degrading monooxygenase HmoA